MVTSPHRRANQQYLVWGGAVGGAVALLLGVLVLLTRPADATRIEKQTDVIYCPRLPEAILVSANKSVVSTQLDLLTKATGAVAASASLGVGREQIATAAGLGMAEFLVVADQLCHDAASGLVTKEQYTKLKYETLPNLRKVVKGPDKRAGFDIAVVGLQVVPLNKEKMRALVDVQFRPLSKDNNEFSTIAYGIVSLHDEKLAGPTGSASSAASCAETASCLGSANGHVKAERPMLLRGGVEPHISQVQVDFPAAKYPKALRAYAEFYQREADAGGTCVADSERAFATDGIPYLKVIGDDGKPRAGPSVCYRAYSAKTFVLAEAKR